MVAVNKIQCKECKIWHYEDRACNCIKLMRNNRKGYNKHKKNPKPKKEPEPFTQHEIIRKCQQLFKEKWLAQRKVLSLVHKLSKYENMLLGYKDIEKRLEAKNGN